MIRASFILAFAWCAARLLGNSTAARRHLLWLVALATASLLPALALIVPAWRPDVAAKVVAALPTLSQVRAVQHAQATGGAIAHAVGIEPAGGGEAILLIVWIAGALFVLLRLLPGARTIRRLRLQSQPLATPAWVRAGFKRKVQLLICPDTSVPLTWGFFLPQILLPGSSSEWPEGRRFSVLAHELAHIRRCDWLFQILAEVACALYWFHPLFWVARNQLHLESERACDDAVLNQGVEGKEYAQHLLDVARSVQRVEPRWSLAMAGQIHLEKRLIAVLKSSTNRRLTTWKTVVSIVLLVLCVAAPIVALRAPAADAESPRVVLYTMPPLYSDAGRKNGIEGVVRIEARIDQEGRPRNLRVMRGLGFGLDENALLAVRNWRFEPARRSDAIAQVDVEFNLRNAELNELIANDMVTNVGPDVVPPRIVHRVEARYPDTAPQDERKRAVGLDVVIQDDGTPKVLRVTQSLSWTADEAAISALEQWRFSPAEKDGAPVKVRMTFQMGFATPIQ